VLVVGVSGDIRESLVDPSIPDVYLPYAQRPGRFVAMLVRAPSRPDLAAAITDAARRVDVTLAPSEILPLAQLVDRERVPRRLLARVLAGVAVVVLVVGAVGLYATIGYLVHQRRREFAVRLAVGADRREIVRHVLRDGGRLTALGLAVGLAASLSLARLLASQLVGVSAFDPLAFALALGVLAGTALLALVLPARQAARIDPMEALRHE
jgi:putative ABC transport system permease protein